MRTFITFSFLILGLSGGVAHAAKSAVEITRVVPTGNDLEAARQITIAFNQKMVPLGKMDRTAEQLGITVTPALKCQWRWLDPSNLACELGESEAMKPATKYTLEIKPGLKSEAGGQLAKAFSHSFTTRLPSESYTTFSKWKSPGWPTLSMTFNQPVSRLSIEKTLFFSFGGKTVAAKALPYEDRNVEFVRKKKDDLWTPAAEKVDPGSVYDSASQYWTIEPSSELPPDTTVEVSMNAGLESALGSLPGNANKSVVEFDTFPEFKFLGFHCEDEAGKAVVASPSEIAKCSPLDGVSLVFSVPVDEEEFKKNLKTTPKLGGGPDENIWEYAYMQDTYGQPHKRGQSYAAGLPRFLKARQKYRVELKGLKDKFNRPLKETIDANFETLPRRPNLNVPYSIGVLEKDETSEIPLYVTNLSSIDFSYSSVTAQATKTMQTHTVKPGKVQDIAFAVPMDVRKMLGAPSGTVTGYYATTPSLPQEDQKFFFQVTPFQVLTKLGHYDTTVWVTDMKTGAPVPDAEITLIKSNYDDIGSAKPVQPAKKTDAKGLVTLAGNKDLDPKRELHYMSGWDKPAFMVKVRRGTDIAILPLTTAFSVDSYRINSSVYPHSTEKWGHMRAWGTTAQGVYKAGDTIQYKIYVRNQSNVKFVKPPAKSYTLIIRDPTGKEVMKKEKITLNEFGAFHGEFKTSPASAVGWHEFALSASFTEKTWEPLRVMVADFTPVPFKVDTRLNGDLFQAGDNLTIETQATMHAGGPYADAPARITGLFLGQTFESKHPDLKDFFFGYNEGAGTQQVFQVEGKVDSKGKLVTKQKLEALSYDWGVFSVESAVSDDRGKNVASMASGKYTGLDRRIGLKNTEWVYRKGEEAKVLYAVADTKGLPVAGTNVNISIQREDVKITKVKGAGNAYLNQYETVWVDVAKCSGKSQNAPSTCKFVPPAPGNYKIEAQITDSKKRPHVVKLDAWVVGKGQMLWATDDNNALPIYPEKDEYKIGDKARFLVKNPLPGALALVTIERYGVMKSWTTKLEDSTAIIEVPIEADMVPGFYLSVAAVSPRVKTSEPLGAVDLGKPSFRMGLIQVDVKDPIKEMIVTAKVAKDTYRPRDKVQVALHAEPRVAGKAGEPIEIAVAVLDEAVLSLVQGGTKYYDPYKGFYSLDSLDVQTYNLLTNLVGRQKFEKKGANQGGGGGLGDDVLMRDLIKYVSYWNPSMKLDAKGNANFEFTLPDNLTGWRILAMAVTPDDRMGLGQKEFKVNKPTELRPVMPNQVTEGDSFKAGFSVMNRTDQARKIEIQIEAAGTVKGGAAVSKKEVLDMKPRERRTVFIDVTSDSVKQDRNTSNGLIKLKAVAKDAVDSDGLAHEVPVYKRRSLETAAAYGTTTEKSVTEDIQVPKDIYPDIGSISVTASPSVIANIEGAFQYMRDYPYSCWEQKLTKGVTAAQYTQLKAYLPGVKWADAAEVAKTTLSQAETFQAPNGGMVYFVADDRHVDPYLSAYTALAFQWLRAAGHAVPEKVEGKLHTYLLSLLKNKVVPTFYDEGMESTVRAVALLALVKAKKVDHNEVKRYFSAMPKMSLFGKAHFLMAAIEAGQTDDQQLQTMNKILAQGNQTSGKFMFNETWQDSWERMLATPIRDNCAVLSAVVKYAKVPAGEKLVGDVPFRLVRSLTQSRGARDYYENTQENMFCMQSLIDYAKVNESVPPQFTVSATLDGKKFGEGTFVKVTDPMKTFERPLQASDVGKKSKVQINREGQGRLYYATRIAYGLKEDKADVVNAGMDVRREYYVKRDKAWTRLQDNAEVKRGELVRVELYASLPAARNFVVIKDPVPGGMEPVNRDLANTSQVDADDGVFKPSGGSYFLKFNDWVGFQESFWSFYHQELRHDSVRFYSDYLAPGNYNLSYTAQVIAPGSFSAAAAHAEEMYDPDVFGKSKSAVFTVKE